ncbi:hypothetical protein COT30_00030 [Candidatus Micrarchaeota archaeon CG08_land_8_20_14_0_20_49_17]|nr:MAG: hypothetical protein AUJ13_00195 [Candidatus Micrarchaeota archaeon CG1_02_49_24]PIU10289.1 MAG: hypothetical protein COT30_00030 [Candidatus Micrarchaeota archaeon CG08_land_8_20_14_0_20_49_17]PIU81762.1 MAG: hypothetical protein COS70_02535 [Candidatus Micrarchaeota archaeon CG06_land_8_20_14_3_00_50_6]PIZ99678.1 MAG: hypothetical protein COX84_00660 [Candidatus Micrarchaeota archaeon CG_4_10_14_0_2_um_filter_49_7]HII53333.1 NAD(P)H-hydrate dehydratase [Candidatus Micrarchaeota archae
MKSKDDGNIWTMRVLDRNLEYLSFPVVVAMENAGRSMAGFFTKKHGSGRRIAIFCGPGNNGGDGYVMARYIERKNAVDVYVVAPPKTEASSANLSILRKLIDVRVALGKSSNLAILAMDGNIDATKKYDFIIDAIFGAGARVPLSEPFKSAVDAMNKLNAKKIAVDLPTPSFKAREVYSANVAKAKGALVADIGIPPELMRIIGPGDVFILSHTRSDSHKGENGKLLIVAGGRKYHGAAQLAIKASMPFVDLVYFHSTSENMELLKSIKKISEVICLNEKETIGIIGEIDAVLIGPGMDIDARTKQKAKKIIALAKKQNKKIILDASAFKLFSKKDAGGCLLTPHAGEFKSFFGIEGSAKNVAKMAAQHNCIILRKGVVDVISDSSRTKLNFTGNAGLTKGGTGDILAGLCASFACKNNLFESACAAIYLNCSAGGELLKTYDTAYSCEHLLEQIPKTYLKLVV